MVFHKGAPGQSAVGVVVDIEIVGAGIAAPLLRRHNTGRVGVVRLAVVHGVPGRAGIDDLHNDGTAGGSHVFAAIGARVLDAEAGRLGALRDGPGAGGPYVMGIERGAGFLVTGMRERVRKGICGMGGRR